jgi:hypothetical protein
MSKISSINPTAAKDNPERTFNSPKAVAGQVGLTRAEKLTVLKRWRDQVQRRLDSASEGMAPPTSLGEVEGRSADPLAEDAELLRVIEIELEALMNSDSD